MLRRVPPITVSPEGIPKRSPSDVLLVDAAVVSVAKKSNFEDFFRFAVGAHGGMRVSLCIYLRLSRL